MTDNPTPRRVRFGVFELDARTGELRKSGTRLKLQDQPFQILRELVLAPGELVTREQLQQKLWPDDTFVDFEHSLNAAVKKLRDILGDSARSPRYIETLPKKGYRFIAPVELVDIVPDHSRRKIAVAVGAVALAAVVAFAVWPEPEPTFVRFNERPLTSDIGSERLASLSPDGTRVAYSWFDRDPETTDSDIYVKLVDIPSSKPLPVTQDPESSDWWPAWSPDGTQIAFIREGDPEARYARSPGGPYHLMVAPASSGPAQRLTSFAARANFYTKPAWSPDGEHIVFAGQLDPDKPTTSNRILLYSFDTKSARELTEDPGGAGFMHPVFSPDGETLAFPGRLHARGWYTLALDERFEPRGEPHLVAPGVGGPNVVARRAGVAVFLA